MRGGVGGRVRGVDSCGRACVFDLFGAAAGEVGGWGGGTDRGSNTHTVTHLLHKSYAHCHSAICADSGVAMCIRFMQQDRKVPGSNPTQCHLDRLLRKGREIQSPATGHKAGNLHRYGEGTGP